MGYAFRQRRKCPACRSEKNRTAFQGPLDTGPVGEFLGAYYKIDPGVLREGSYLALRCGDCATLFQGEVGDERLLSDLYGLWIGGSHDPELDPDYAYAVANPSRSRDGHEIMAAGAFLNKPLSSLVTLDYGCGMALWARIAALLGCRSIASDVAEDRMAYARRHGIQTVPPDGLGTEIYHFINLEQVLEHLTDVEITLQHLVAALRPGGVLKISVPAQAGIEQLFERLKAGGRDIQKDEIDPLFPLEHVNAFNEGGLRSIATRFGLEVVRPGLLARYAFLGARGSLDFRDPSRLIKELVRPIAQYRTPANLYVWLRKPATTRSP